MGYFTPNEAVVDSHSIPHLIYDDGRLSEGPNSFDLRAVNGSVQNILAPSGYLTALVPFPTLITGLGLFSILLFQFCVCLRCCRCCSFLKQAPDQEMITLDPLIVYRRKRMLKAFFCFFLFVVLLASHSLWLANKDLDDSIVSMGASVDSLLNIFTTLQQAGEKMETDFDLAYNKIDENRYCYTSPDYLLAQAVVGKAAASGITSLSSPLVPLLSQGSTQVVENGTKVKLYLVAALYALAMALMIALGSSMFFRCKRVLQFFMVFTGLLLLLLTVVSGVETVVAMILGDFCMDPIKSLTDLTTSTYATDVINFYGRCDGTASNPFSGDVSNVDTAMNKLNTEFHSDSPGCDAVYTGVTEYYKDALGVQLVLVTNQVTQCESLHKVIDEFLLTGVCTLGVQGFFKLYVQQYIIQLGLFLCLVVGSVLYQYFEIWSMDQDGSDRSMTNAMTTDDGDKDKHDDDDNYDDDGSGGDVELGAHRRMYENPAFGYGKDNSHPSPAKPSPPTHHRANPITARMGNPEALTKAGGGGGGGVSRGNKAADAQAQAQAQLPARLESEFFEIKTEPRSSKAPRNFAPGNQPPQVHRAPR